MTTFNDKCTHDALFGATEDRPDGGEWETPDEFYRKLDEEFHFTLDAAASIENAKCPRFFTKADDSLSQVWDGIVFCNPPYGKEIGTWLEKGRLAASQGSTVVFLVHARTDTRWFHNHVYGIADEIRFVKGRLKFKHKDGANQSAPFPSMIVVYRPKREII
jgi:phage N-6-adenine-methyltransferase